MAVLSVRRLPGLDRLRSLGRRTPGGHRPTTFRPDIQGLRAIAVLLVACSHAGVPHLDGGYVGVDVFFVISGFLISGWLIRRTKQLGRVPFGEFYAARARRILPAATLTLVVTAIASRYLLNYVRAMAALRDCEWATFFAANIHFANIGTDYFARDNPPSPVQHFWSLAVEEQFYFIWPALFAVLVAALLRRRRAGGPRRALDDVFLRRVTVIVGVLVLASIAWSVWNTQHSPTDAYFSAFTRAWELGVGVLIALTTTQLTRLPRTARIAASVVGMAGIIVAGVVFTAATPFPGYAALLPVLATALVLIGGLGDTARSGAGIVLSRQPLRLVGDVSYGFYLWHWPFLIIAKEHEGHDLSLSTNLLLLGGALLASLVMYVAFENPLRHSRRLATPRASLLLWPVSIAALMTATSISTLGIEKRLSNQEVAAVAADPTLTAGIVDTAGATPTDTGADAAATTATTDATTGASTTSSDTTVAATPFTAAVGASVTADRLAAPVPAVLSPLVKDLANDTYDLGGCEAQVGSDASSKICRLGNVSATKTMVVFGDSHSQEWMPGAVTYATDHDLALVPLIKEGCTGETWLVNTPDNACGSWQAWAIDQIAQLKPDLLLIGESFSGSMLAGGNDATAATTGLGKELATLSTKAPKVVLIQDPPELPREPTDCLLANGATLGSCSFPLEAPMATIQRQVGALAASRDVRYIPTLQWFCADGQCPTVVGSTIAYRDRGHISLTYSTRLQATFATSLAAVLEGA